MVPLRHKTFECSQILEKSLFGFFSLNCKWKPWVLLNHLTLSREITSCLYLYKDWLRKTNYRNTLEANALLEKQAWNNCMVLKWFGGFEVPLLTLSVVFCQESCQTCLILWRLWLSLQAAQAGSNYRLSWNVAVWNTKLLAKTWRVFMKRWFLSQLFIDCHKSFISKEQTAKNCSQRFWQVEKEGQLSLWVSWVQ